MTRKTSLFLAVALTALGTVACGLDQPAPRPPVVPDPTTPTNPDPTNPDPTKKPVAPVLDPGLATTTCADTVGVIGTAQPGVTIFAVGGAATSGISTDAHPQSGRFCLPVVLKKGQPNTIEIRAQDPVLGISDPVTVTVTHDGCNGGDDGKGPTTPTVEPKNVALGAPARAKATATKGNEMFLTDGKSSTSATYSGGAWYCPWCEYGGWVAVKLDKVHKLGKIVVKWADASGSGTAYGSQYRVLVSSMSDPGDPNLDNGLWVEVRNITDGNGGIDVHDLKSTQPLAQHVAIWLAHDGSTSWNETFSISEIEAWDAPDKQAAPPPTQTDVCAGGGN